jgi:hypothetical protein
MRPVRLKEAFAESRARSEGRSSMNAIRPAALVSWLLVAALLPANPAHADIVVLKDPDAWMQQAMDNIGNQKFDEVTRDFFRLIDKPVSEPFAASLRSLGSGGKPVFIEKVSDAKFGDVLRQVTWVALYPQTDYVYFSFIIKKNRGGYAITNFKFKTEAANLFPEGYYAPQ